MSKMYFKGGAGITNPVDVNGDEIKVGDILTHDWFDGDYIEFFNKYYPKMSTDDIEKRVLEPSVVVKFNADGYFFGEGFQEGAMKLYMHDFRFKYTKIVKQ